MLHAHSKRKQTKTCRPIERVGTEGPKASSLAGTGDLAALKPGEDLWSCSAKTWSAILVFLWSRGQRYRAWIKNGDLEKKCHCYLYVPLAALIPLAIAHSKRVHKYKHAIQANTSGRMFLLLANVISVPGMNTFIEPKHTLQSHNPYANVIGIGECGQRSDLERFIKGLYNLRRRMGYIGKSVYFVILQGRITFNYTDREREIWLCIPCWFKYIICPYKEIIDIKTKNL